MQRSLTRERPESCVSIDPKSPTYIAYINRYDRPVPKRDNAPMDRSAQSSPASSLARISTRSSIGPVSRPVFVFCSEG